MTICVCVCVCVWCALLFLCMKTLFLLCVFMRVYLHLCACLSVCVCESKPLKLKSLWSEGREIGRKNLKKGGEKKICSPRDATPLIRNIPVASSQLSLIFTIVHSAFST